MTASDKPAGYATSERAEIRGLLPRGFSSLLDVGCAEGNFGKGVKECHQCRVWGIELDPHYAAKAAQKLDRVFVGDAETILPTLPMGSFDVITFNDVLEHMARPDEVLRGARSLLAPSGSIICSIPNIRNWLSLWHILVQADFRYRASGIFDQTHLRFFTKKSATRLLTGSGFQVESARGLGFLGNRPLLRRIGWLLSLPFPDVRYTTFVFVARIGE